MNAGFTNITDNNKNKFVSRIPVPFKKVFQSNVTANSPAAKANPKKSRIPIYIPGMRTLAPGLTEPQEQRMNAKICATVNEKVGKLPPNHPRDTIVASTKSHEKEKKPGKVTENRKQLKLSRISASSLKSLKNKFKGKPKASKLLYPKTEYKTIQEPTEKKSSEFMNASRCYGRVESHVSKIPRKIKPHLLVSRKMDSSTPRQEVLLAANEIGGGNKLERNFELCDEKSWATAKKTRAEGILTSKIGEQRSSGYMNASRCYGRAESYVSKIPRKIKERNEKVKLLTIFEESKEISEADEQLKNAARLENNVELQEMMVEASCNGNELSEKLAGNPLPEVDLAGEKTEQNGCNSETNFTKSNLLEVDLAEEYMDQNELNCEIPCTDQKKLSKPVVVESTKSHHGDEPQKAAENRKSLNLNRISVSSIKALKKILQRKPKASQLLYLKTEYKTKQEPTEKRSSEFMNASRCYGRVESHVSKIPRKIKEGKKAQKSGDGQLAKAAEEKVEQNEGNSEPNFLRTDEKVLSKPVVVESTISNRVDDGGSELPQGTLSACRRFFESSLSFVKTKLQIMSLADPSVTNVLQTCKQHKQLTKVDEQLEEVRIRSQDNVEIAGQKEKPEKEKAELIDQQTVYIDNNLKESAKLVTELGGSPKEYKVEASKLEQSNTVNPEIEEMKEGLAEAYCCIRQLEEENRKNLAMREVRYSLIRSMQVNSKTEGIHLAPIDKADKTLNERTVEMEELFGLDLAAEHIKAKFERFEIQRIKLEKDIFNLKKDLKELKRAGNYKKNRF